MRKLGLVLSVVLSFAWLSASAVDVDDFHVRTTRDLFDLCSAKVDHELHDAAKGFCLGFVDAAHDYHHALTSGDLLAPIACSPEGTTREDAVNIFLNWARANPDLMDSESAINGLMRAVSEKWPCSS